MVERDNLPRPAPDIIEDGIPATSEIPEDELATGDTLEGEIPPLDHPQAVNQWGTTVAEQLEPEPFDVRIAHLQPEVRMGDDHTERQLFQPGADASLADDEADAVAEMDAGLEDTLSAEEAAMRVVGDEPPGMNYDPDPGYVDDQEIR